MGQVGRRQIPLFGLIAGPDADTRRLAALQRKELGALAVLQYGNDQAAKYSGILHGLYQAFQELEIV